MTGWDRGEPREPSEGSLARVQAGRNPAFAGYERPEDSPEVRAVLERFRKAVADATEEAFDSLARIANSGS